MGIENLLARGYNLPGLEMPMNLLAKKQELEGNQTRNLLAQMQVQQYMQQQQEAQKQRQALQAFQQSIPSPQMQASQAALSGGGGPTVANAAQMKPVDPRLQMADSAWRAGLIPFGDYMKQAMPAPKAPDYKVVGSSLVQIGQDGVKEAYRAPEKSDTPSAVREYQFAQSQGYKGSFQDFQLEQKRAGAAQTSVNYSQPVEAVDAQGNRVFIRTTKNGLEPAIVPGVRPPMSAAEERTANERKDRERQGQQMLSAITDARRILQTGKATDSGIGNVMDAAGRAVGVTTKGAQDAARLEALSGWLVANVPRMEGPQSNIDVQNYTTMAGRVGDRTVPIAERLAALSEVETLQRKYAAINGTPAATKPGAGGTVNWGDLK